QSEYLKLQCRARPKPTSHRRDHPDQDGNHVHGAYLGKTRTSMVATRTGFSVATRLNPEMRELALATGEAATDLAQRMRSPELAEQHGHELAPTCEAACVPLGLRR